MKKIALAVAVATLALSACSPGELSDFLDEVPGEDLSQSADPALQAAGESVEVIEEIRLVDEQLGGAVILGDVDLIRDAKLGRPDDPRLDLYEAAVLTVGLVPNLRNDEDTAIRREVDQAVVSAAQKVHAQWPEASREVVIAIVHEMYIDALLDVITNGPGVGGDSGAAIDAYCHYVSAYRDVDQMAGIPPEIGERSAGFIAAGHAETFQRVCP
jgi:hypothetical protein